jgi:hypothetical protein
MGLHRTFGYLPHLGDLLHRESLNLPENENFPVFYAQTVERLLALPQLSVSQGVQ